MSKEQEINDYIERYAKNRGITKEVASTHLMVKEYIKYKTSQKPTNNERYYH